MTTPAAVSSNPSQPLRSVYTPSLPALLQQAGVSVLITTFKVNKLVIVRVDQQGMLNTHFCDFMKPMGLALNGDRLAVGTYRDISEFHNVPAVAAKADRTGKVDACFLPRTVYHTGSIQVHEMGWAGEELWFVNTLFSCLCVRHPAYSFVARWRPPFITALAAEDRCHLNAVGVRDGQPRYATALAATDTPSGWREHKKDGGVLIDIQRNEVLLRGLSMPHSPRWYQGKLWLLNSGDGGFGFVDEKSGRYENVTTLPGFTRGLDFFGNLAFIGMSQVRETATFSGIAIAARPERMCGMFVVDITTGQPVAFMQFKDAVQEVFAVQVLPGIRFPDIINDNEELLAGSYVALEEYQETAPGADRLYVEGVTEPARTRRVFTIG